MNVMIVGLGSMGRRRCRLLKKYDSSIYAVGVDSRADRRIQSEREFAISTEESIEKACYNNIFDSVFVCTSPLSHASIIKECLERKLNVFTEINLSDNMYDVNLALAAKNDRVLFLSSTFLYRKEIEYIKKEVKEYSGKLSYVYHAGQYLPDWHPWETYKDFFVGEKATNGCREFMAIDFPWIVDVFGKVVKVHSVSNKLTTLDIDFPDSYQVLFEHDSGHRGMISMDIVSRKAVRNFEVFGEKLYIAWNGVPSGLIKYNFESKMDEYIQLYNDVDRQDGYSSFVVENAYLSEIENFMDVIRGISEPRYSFEKDRDILSIIDIIERNEK